MSNYNPLTNFTAKDSLTTGDPQKIIRGADFDAEFDSISTAVNSKANANNAALTGSSTAVNLDITGTFELGGVAVTSTAAELNILDGVTATTAELNILDGVTANTAELNILDGVTANTAEINILDGVTASTAELNLLDGVTASTAELNILDGVTASTAELNLLDGVTASTAELNQLDGNVFTADLTIPDKIIHAGDTNTAIRFPAADTWAVETAGTERVRVDSTGNVGIGTNSASAWNSPTLQIAGTVSLTNIQTSTQLTNNAFFDGAWKYQTTAASANYFQLAGEHVWRVAASGTAGSALTWTEALRIDSTGNVGIGTTSPTSALTVSGRIETVDGADIDMDSSASGHLMLDGAGYGAAIALNAQGANFYTNSASRGIIFGVNETEVMRIDSSGNVGIGTSSLGMNAAGLPLVVGSGSGNTGMTIYSGAASSGSIHFGDTVTTGTDSYSGFVNYSHSTNSMQFGTSGVEKMRIDATGNVGIGTTSPAKLLHVDGTIRYTNRPAAGTITALGFDTNGDLKASSSSLRYKHDIQDYGKGLVEVMQLRPVSFKFNGEDITNIGFIAEEVDALGMTEVMLYDAEDRPEGIQYANMVSLLTKAIQEQQNIIEQLTARVAELESKV